MLKNQGDQQRLQSSGSQPGNELALAGMKRRQEIGKMGKVKLQTTKGGLLLWVVRERKVRCPSDDRKLMQSTANERAAQLWRSASLHPRSLSRLI